MSKKIILSLLLVFVSVFAFSQKDAFSKDILKLMESKNGTGVYKDLVNDLSLNIDKDKVTEFKNLMTKNVDQSIQDAIPYFKSNFTHKEIIEIYSEFNSDTLKYSDKTIKYIKLWNRYKAEFSNKAKNIYSQF